jgi:hypothetical protein
MTDSATNGPRTWPLAKTPLALLLLTTLAAAQTEPTPPDSAKPAAKPEPLPPAIVIRVGHLHPVTDAKPGADLGPGVIVIRGEQIVAVGPADQVTIPEGATIHEHPDAHAYPGLVDALSSACRPRGGDGIGDAGGEMALALDWHDELSRKLVEHGITTAYVSSRNPSPWRGKGALVHLGAGDPIGFPGGESAAGIHFRLAAGGPVHPLLRQDQLQALGAEFGQLEAYEKSFKEYEEKLAEYQKKFGEYLDWHRKKNGKSEPTAAAPSNAAQSDAGQPQPGARRGRRGRPDGGTPGGEPPPAPTPGPTPTPAPTPSPTPPPSPAPTGGPTPPAGGAANPAANPAAQAAEEKPPERPKPPTAPLRDPAKDALIEVRDGKRTLFVEIDQPEEVERALDLAREHGIAKMVFEVAANAGGAVEAIAEAGIPVIVLGADPLPLPPSAAFGDAPTAPIAVALAEHGVPIAIGSAAVARARHLPQIAGEAVGAGVDADRALRAITRDAAAILGVGDHCGSLEVGKLADVLVTTAPLFAPECRILRVYSRGEIAHAAR